MNEADPQMIDRFYRGKNQLELNAVAAVGNIAILIIIGINPWTAISILLAVLCGATTLAMAGARIAYRTNPYCGTCGIDTVDCKMNRRTLKEHTPTPTPEQHHQ